MSTERINQGGLMRCCTGTWSDMMIAHPDGWNDGDIIDCRYCHSSMIRTLGVWRWNHEWKSDVSHGSVKGRGLTSHP